MATLLLSAVSMFCSIPCAPIFGSILAACIPISPVSWIVYASWFAALKFGKQKWLQRFRGSTKTMLKNTLIFYFATVLPFYAVVLFIACRAAG
ncbi:hypothetical protein WJX74_000380 [Apatococcus lobatus]|uniref:Uncharacterized protein n=1 Tax=Apatococcus lobatus TaxID=904363 RepID=A0AAW1Q6W8_9CHLO